MASRVEIRPDSLTAFKVAAEVAANPGREVHEIARALCWTVRHCSKALTGAKNGGLIGISRFGSRARWYSVEALIKVREAEQTESKQRARVLDKRRKERYLVKQLDKLAAASPDLSDEPIRTIVPAGVPLPFKCRAVNSVFALGAA